MDLITTNFRNSPPFAARLAKHPEVITVDAEFSAQETTYYPLLCVVQMASAEEAVVVDTLAPGIDLKPFFELMADEKVLKVFHAARQDIEIVWHQSGTIPHPIFDTQVAAMVLGYGDSIAYDQLVERIAGHRPDKTHRFTDWSRRPLTDDQMHYAVSDVTHLREVFAALDVDLKKRGRSDWVSEEMEVLTSPKTYDFHPERAWERLKARVRKPKELAAGADGSRGLARAGGAKPRRPAQPRAQGRCGRRHRHPCPDQPRAAGKFAFAAEGLRPVEMGRRHRGCRAARHRARSADAAEDREAAQRDSNGAAIVRAIRRFCCA